MDLSLKIWWPQTSTEQHQAQKVLDHSLIKLERTFDKQIILATSWEQLQVLLKRLLFLNDKQILLIQTIRFPEQLSMLEQLDMLWIELDQVVLRNHRDKLKTKLQRNKSLMLILSSILIKTN